jgi:ABC-type sugar transport system ATPase subunit
VAVIRDGRVVQIDTPRNLYTGPQDTYVAGLVGAPAMNLLPATIAAGEPRIVVDLGEGALDLGPSAIGLASGMPLFVGLRPHDIRLGADSTRGRVVPARVHLREPLGDVIVLDLRLGAHEAKMVVREEQGASIVEGSAIEVTIDPADLHLFAAETGVRLV